MPAIQYAESFQPCSRTRYLLQESCFMLARVARAGQEESARWDPAARCVWVFIQAEKKHKRLEEQEKKEREEQLRIPVSRYF